MARASRTTKQINARERAREARLRVHAEREERDREIEEAATAYFLALDERTEITKRVAVIEDKMATAIERLLDLRETPPRIAELLGTEARKVRRIRAQRDKATQGSATDDQAATSEYQPSSPSSTDQI